MGRPRRRRSAPDASGDGRSHRGPPPREATSPRLTGSSTPRLDPAHSLRDFCASRLNESRDDILRSVPLPNLVEPLPTSRLVPSGPVVMSAQHNAPASSRSNSGTRHRARPATRATAARLVHTSGEQQASQYESRCLLLKEPCAIERMEPAAHQARREPNVMQPGRRHE